MVWKSPPGGDAKAEAPSHEEAVVRKWRRERLVFMWERGGGKVPDSLFADDPCLWGWS